MATFKKSFEPKLIYVYRINDEAHEGVLKIGEASQFNSCVLIIKTDKCIIIKIKRSYCILSFRSKYTGNNSSYYV